MHKKLILRKSHLLVDFFNDFKIFAKKIIKSVDRWAKVV